MTLLLSCLIEQLGIQVRTEWLKDPVANGEVFVNDLSVGEHYFACSVGDHCLRGMRLTVRVESGAQQAPAQESQVRRLIGATSQITDLFYCQQVSEHTVRWLIQDYEDLTISEGEAVTFAWDGFHSLHQVSKLFG